MPDGGRIAGPLVIPNAFQCRMIWTLANGRTVFNVLHGIVSAGVVADTALAQAIYASLIASASWTAWKALINTGNSLAGIDLRDLRTANMPLVQSTGAAVAGTGAGGAIPPGDAFCVTLRTAGAGRSFRGRVYLPGLDFSALAAGGVAAAGTMTAAVNFITALQTAMNASGVEMAVANPQRAAYTSPKGTVHVARAAAMQPVTGIVARNNIMDHQRRRAGRS